MALQLLKRNKKILIIDSTHPNTATQVAAGLFNPVTGRNMTKTWMAETLFTYLHQFYREAETITGKNFFHPMPLYRPFVSIEEQNEWMGKSEDASLHAFLEHVHTTPVDVHQVQNKFGGLLLKQCGYLNTLAFSEAIRHHLSHAGSLLLEENFSEEELQVEAASVTYRNYHAKKIIFCQGESVRSGKFFSWLPIQPLKGETLTIQTQEVVTKIYNRGAYVVPGIWKVGATYQFKDTAPAVTAAARQELKDKLRELVSFPYEITDQSWGMRPTTPDRRPILGAHPEWGSLVIFNGLGTKGVSLAPYFSDVLTGWLENGTPINKEVDIHRYKHYNYGGNLLR